jgi:caspase domain-containing protein
MSRTAFPRTLMATAVLFGLVSTGFVSIAWVKAPHNFPLHRAVITKSYAANQSATARSDHVALLIANSNYPDADDPLPEVAAGADLLANVLHSHGFVVDVVRDATRAGITEAVDRLKAETRPGSISKCWNGWRTKRAESSGHPQGDGAVRSRYRRDHTAAGAASELI